jgi:protein TonB
MVLAASTASAQQVQSQERAVKPETAKPPALSRSQSTPTAAAPSGGPLPSDWRNQVSGILEQNKRYPPSARSNNEEGRAHLSFTVNRQGRVTSAQIDRSSGSAALDAETLALVHRVSFPPPPAEMARQQINLGVWVRYNLGPARSPCGRFGIYWVILCRLTQPPSAPTSFRPSDTVSRTYASSSEDVATIRQRGKERLS